MNVAILEENTLLYTDQDRNATLSKTKVGDHLEDYIELVKLKDGEELMSLVSKTLKLNESNIGNTTVIYEDYEYMYEICFVENNTLKNKNQIAINLTKCYRPVVGDCIIIKNKINPDYSSSIVSITVQDIIDIYYSTLVHKGVRLNTDGSMSQFIYIRSPIDTIKPEQVYNMRYYEVELYNKIIMVFLQLKPDKQELNKKATYILSMGQVLGDVYIGMRHKEEDGQMTEHEYCDLTEKDINNLLDVITHTINADDKSFDVNPDLNYKVVDGVKRKVNTFVENFYTVLSSKVSKFKNSNLDVLDRILELGCLNDKTLDLVNNCDEKLEL